MNKKYDYVTLNANNDPLTKYQQMVKNGTLYNFKLAELSTSNY